MGTILRREFTGGGEEKICFMTVFLRISTWALIPKLTLDERHFGDGGESLNRGGAYSNIDRKNIEDF